MNLMRVNKTTILSITKRLPNIFKSINWKARLGFILLAFIIIIAILEPYINYMRLGGRDPMEVGNFPRWLRASWEHPLGTDAMGRDLLAVTLAGLKYTIMISFISGGMATIIAVTVGFIAGYIGKWVDAILRSIIDSFLVIPTLPIYLLLATYIPRINLPTMCAILAIFSWPFAARTVRAQVLSLRNRDFVFMAKACGLNELEIIFKELMVNMLPYIFLAFASSVIGAAFAETGARMLGIGPQDIPTLGLVLNWVFGSAYLMQGRYLEVIVPLSLLILIFISLNLIIIGLDEMFNPRLKKITGL